MTTITEQTIDVTKARECLHKMDEMLENDQILYCTRRGKSKFAFVDIEYLESLRETLDVLSDPGFQKVWKKFKNTKPEDLVLHDHADVMKTIGL